MKKLLILLMILTAHIGYAGNISTWLGTGLNPITTSEYPERDDLTRWVSATSSVVFAFNNVALHNGKLYAIKMIGSDAPGEVYQSDDAIVWSKISTTAPIPQYGDSGSGSLCSYDDKLWWLGGNYRSKAYSSSDGITWTLTNLNIIPYMRGGAGATFKNKLYYVGGNGTILNSTDGISWSILTTIAPWRGSSGSVDQPRVIGFGNYLYVFSSNFTNTSYYRTTDGITWDDLGLPGTNVYSVFSYNGYLVVGGSGNGVKWKYTTDGVVWSGGDSSYYGILPKIRGHIFRMIPNSTSLLRSY